MISNKQQLNLHLIGEVPQMKDADPDVVLRFTSPYEAVRYCTRKRTDEFWADLFDVTQGTFNNIINADKKHNDRPRHFPLNWIYLIQVKSGCRAISQYFEAEAKGWLNIQQKNELTLEEKAKKYDEMMEAQA